MTTTTQVVMKVITVLLWVVILLADVNDPQRTYTFGHTFAVFVSCLAVRLSFTEQSQ